MLNYSVFPMSIRLLVIEDDERIVRMLSRYLGERGYVIHGTTNLLQLAETIDDYCPDLLLLDWMLPTKSGLDTLRELRRTPRFADLPVIMLTAKNDEIDRVEGLLTGADDYVSKPFSLAELEARITSVLRRTARRAATYHDDYLEVNPSQKILRVNGVQHTLSLQEWAVLEKLIATPRVILRDEFIAYIWGQHPPASSRSLDNIIMRLRKLIEPTESPRYIVTERGSGYRFVRQRAVGADWLPSGK
jgi:two-component system phosphate regulon response regulator PhoB